MDYERQIEQHIKIQQLWCVPLHQSLSLHLYPYVAYRNADFKKFNEREEEMRAMDNSYHQLEKRLGCCEASITQLQESAL